MNNLIKKNIFKIFLLLILILSFCLRFYQLGVNPPSLTWDEASIGYNAYSILKTGADEYGNKLPLSIRSFDDYKPPLYVYLSVPSIAVFGLNEIGVRFPAAVFGFLSVVVVYFLVKEIFIDWENDKKEKMALLSAFFLGISPWHLQFSRAAFEGNIGLFFFLLGFLLFLKSLKDPKWAIISMASFVLSIYSYHSFRIVAPIFVLICVFYFWKEIWKSKKYYIMACIAGIILATPVLLSFVSVSGGGSRLAMVSSLSAPETLKNSIKELDYDKTYGDQLGSLFHNRRIVYFMTAAKGYFDHLNFDFLFFHGDGGVQHHAVNMGMLYLWDLPFILLGIYILISRRTKRSKLLLLMFLLAPLPAAVTTGTPHPVRAIAMEPGFSVFAALGVYKLFFEEKKIANKIILTIVSAFFAINFMYYLHQYYVHTPIEYGYFWQYGYKEAFADIKPLEEEYNKIIFTYKYDQPYIYYLFYNKIDPPWYQKNWNYLRNGEVERMKRVIGKYEFRNISFDKDKNLINTLLIGTPDEISESTPNIIKTIYYLDGSAAFRIVGT